MNKKPTITITIDSETPVNIVRNDVTEKPADKIDEGETDVSIALVPDYAGTASTPVSSTSVFYATGNPPESVIDGDASKQSDESAEWNYEVTAVSGTAPYTMRMYRDRPGYGVQDITDVAVRTDDTLKFTSGGNILNTGRHWVEIVDADAAQHESVNLDLEIIQGDGSGSGEDPVITAPSMSVSIATSGSGSGAGGGWVSGDSIPVTVTSENTGDEALPNVELTANSFTLTSGTTAASLAIGASNVWQGEVLVDAAIEASGLTNITATVNSDSLPSQSVQTAVVTGDRAIPDVGIGLWGEDRNAIDPCPDIYGNPGTSAPPNRDPNGWGLPVLSILDNSTFAHMKCKTLDDSSSTSISYAVNMINAARARGCRLDLALVSENEIGYNTATLDGFFNQPRATGANGVERFKNKIDEYYNDLNARNAIIAAMADGTIRYFFIMDEPNHKRWSTGYNHTTRTGGSIVVTSEMLDEMAAHVKLRFGATALTIVRTSALNLMAYCGDRLFTDLTHAYITINSSKWRDGGAAEGLERWLTRRPWRPKGSSSRSTGEIGAYIHAGLKMALMVQTGYESAGSHPDGVNNGQWVKDDWWENGLNLHLKNPAGANRTQADKPYMKCSPWEMEWWIKSVLTLRHPTTGVIDPTGIRFCDDITYFRGDRKQGGSGINGQENYFRRPHIVEHYELMKADIASGNLQHSAHPKIQIGMDSV